jgi:hypothetical protein
MRVFSAAAAAASIAALAAAAFGATPQPKLVTATAVGDRVNLTFSVPLAQTPGGAVAVAVNGTRWAPRGPSSPDAGCSSCSRRPSSATTSSRCPAATCARGTAA